MSTDYLGTASTARLLGVSRSALRRYERWGWLTHSRAGDLKQYPAADVLTLAAVPRGQRTAAAVNAAIRTRARDRNREIEDIVDAEASLARLRRRLSATEGILDQLQDAADFRTWLEKSPFRGRGAKAAREGAVIQLQDLTEHKSSDIERDDFLDGVRLLRHLSADDASQRRLCARVYTRLRRWYAENAKESDLAVRLAGARLHP